MNTYDTSDFQLAVTLYTLGYSLLEVDKTNRNRAVFRFLLEGRIKEDAGSFFSDILSLNPRLLLTNTKMVKDRLHSGA